MTRIVSWKCNCLIKDGEEARVTNTNTLTNT